MALSTRVDNLLLVLYAPGASGQVNDRIPSVGRLQDMVCLLQQEGQLWLPRGRSNRYVMVQSEFGVFCADFFDDLFALHGLGFLSLERISEAESAHDSLDLRRYFRDLTHGDQLYKEFESVAHSSVALAVPSGVRIGASLYEALLPDESAYLCDLKARALAAGRTSESPDLSQVTTARTGLARPGASPSMQQPPA
jgi:hypothetical protein